MIKKPALQESQVLIKAKEKLRKSTIKIIIFQLRFKYIIDQE